MPASWGHRSLARPVSFWRSDVWVRSCGSAMWPSCLAACPAGPAALLMPGIPARPGSAGERSAVPFSPYVICLGDAGRAGLGALSRRATAPCRMVLRARIVLMAAGGAANCVIAERPGTGEDTARKWRRRYCGKGLEGLADAPPAGPAPQVPAGGRVG